MILLLKITGKRTKEIASFAGVALREPSDIGRIERIRGDSRIVVGILYRARASSGTA